MTGSDPHQDILVLDAPQEEDAGDAKGYRVRLSTAKKTFYEPQDSDVVCFRGHASDEERTARSLVQTSSLMFHLPPLATVTLEQIVAPNQWSAYGKVVARRLFVVSVAFTC